ncbi:O-fucosyltransferase family protein [Trifolium repens]|nr:O-fucosyltransferase family protein [Trifolium repens]
MMSLFIGLDLLSPKVLHIEDYGVKVKRLESLYPDSNPRGYYPDPGSQTNGVRIQGDFHEIRNSIADVVVVARLLNATLAMPEIQSTTSSKGISSQFKSFAYLYNEDQFICSLAKDVKVFHIRHHLFITCIMFSNGVCLQAILPPNFEEYQSLRCRVSFHALQFGQEVQELSAKVLQRLRAPSRPFIAFDPGMT